MNETVQDLDTGTSQQDLQQWLWVHFLAASEVWRDVVESLGHAFTALAYFLLLYLTTGALIYIYLVYYYYKSDSGERISKRVLIVIAHPDDECMFFGPTILKLINSNEVYLLCLSNGNHYKQGTVRKEELYESCKVLGIPQSNVMIMNNTKMPDNPNFIWNAKKTARILLDHIESLSIEEVYTFDIGGVSGHLNHSSIFYGFARLCISENLPPNVKVFLLESVNLVRKYSVFCDAGLSLPFTKRLFIAPLRVSGVIRLAMRKHRSQMVWFRALYIYFSRYMYINAYEELDVDDVHIVLQMSDYDPMS